MATVSEALAECKAAVLSGFDDPARAPEGQVVEEFVSAFRDDFAERLQDPKADWTRDGVVVKRLARSIGRTAQAHAITQGAPRATMAHLKQAWGELSPECKRQYPGDVESNQQFGGYCRQIPWPTYEKP
jgi:hypothetical protein